MPSRRSLLAALATGFAGCGRSGPATPTVTPLETPASSSSPTPPAALTDVLDSSRFDESIVCPGDVPCFHLLDEHANPDRVVVPERERLTPDAPQTTMTTYNRADRPLVLGTPMRVAKWTGIYWAPTHGADVPNDVVVLEPDETLDRSVGTAGRGDGTYALVEIGYFGRPRRPATIRDPGEPRRLAGETRRFGALFEVTGSDWQPTPDEDVYTEREESTLLVEPDRSGEAELVLERSTQSEGVPLVPETVAAHALTKNAVLGLDREGVERVRLPTDGTAMWYLENALISPLDITPELTVRLDEVLFEARLDQTDGP